MRAPRATTWTAEGTSAPAAQLDLRALFDAHYAATCRLLRRLGVRPAQLDDAAQEVFWVCARRLPDIRPGSETSFLYGVALRIASEHVRRQRTLLVGLDLEDAASVPVQEPSPEERLDQRRARELLDRVLDRMSLDLRTVLVLVELEEMEVRDVAGLLEIPTGTAASRLRRAREEFSTIARRLHAALAARQGGY